MTHHQYNPNLPLGDIAQAFVETWRSTIIEEARLRPLEERTEHMGLVNDRMAAWLDSPVKAIRGRRIQRRNSSFFIRILLHPLLVSMVADVNYSPESIALLADPGHIETLLGPAGGVVAAHFWASLRLLHTVR
jgi:hypothetical protein